MLIPGSSNQERYEFIYNIKDPNQGLINAVKIGSLFLVKYYLEQGAKLNKKILRLAAKNGHLDVIKYLVDGVNKGRASHVFLVEQGADLHTENEEALRSAANNGHLDVVKYLVEQGADLHDEDEEALRLAAINGHLDVVKYLIEQGANPQFILNNPNRYQPEIVDYIRKNGGHPFLLDKPKSYLIKIQDCICNLVKDKRE